MNSFCHLRPTVISTLFVLASMTSCQNKVPPPEPEPKPAPPAPAASVTQPANDVSSAAATTQSAGTVASQVASAAANPVAANNAAPVASGAQTTKAAAPAGGDPAQGKFTLEDATKGLAKTGKIVAELVTDAGTLKCELYEDKAPVTVANFVGLARGIRPFKDPKTNEWVKRPAYDSGVFHRIIKGFMIQGGDPLGTGAGEGGFLIPDEIWPGATHDRRGLLCMANRGKNTNSMQFFITDAAAPHLDGGYTIFGACGPDGVIEKLAATEVRGDRAVNPPKIKKVTVKRTK
jgi:peptidyl-prolyl cis-trans isomerase A (cyclophilin A)